MERRCRMLQLRPFQIPKRCRQPRSRSARPPTHRGSLIDCTSCKDGSSSTTTASMDLAGDDPDSRHNEGMPEFSLLRCGMLWNERQEEIILKTAEVPVIEVESVPVNASLVSCRNRNTGARSNAHAGSLSSAEPLPSTPDNSGSPTTGDTDAWLNPGSVVWAKTIYHEWWPAEVMAERDVEGCTDNQHNGHVLVQLFGNHQYVWLDPVGDLSQFDNCYEERSKNTLTTFQDALKQALCKHVDASPRIPCGRVCGELKSSTQYNHSLDTGNTSISSGTTKNNCIEGGRGKRQRKLKLHFDELITPENRMRRSRRLRIMRNLGLAAPIGSPFSLSHGSSA